MDNQKEIDVWYMKFDKGNTFETWQSKKALDSIAESNRIDYKDVYENTIQLKLESYCHKHDLILMVDLYSTYKSMMGQALNNEEHNLCDNLFFISRKDYVKIMLEEM